MPPGSYAGSRNSTARRFPSAAKAELYSVFRASGIKKVELARRLGIPKTTVDRLFDLDHHSRLDQIEGAFSALGKRLAVEVRDAA